MVVAGRSGGEDNALPGRYCAADSLPVTSVQIATITRKKVTPNSPTVKRCKRLFSTEYNNTYA